MPAAAAVWLETYLLKYLQQNKPKKQKWDIAKWNSNSKERDRSNEKRSLCVSQILTRQQLLSYPSLKQSPQKIVENTNQKMKMQPW